MAYNFIAIEGNIGAGKTTLAGLLASDLDAKTLFERFEENPFLEAFYKDPEPNSFQLEMSFLLERYKQLQNANATAGSPLIADYCFDKCLIFARVNLKRNELALFEDFFEILKKQLPQPDLIIYLRSGPDTLKHNIAKRGRPYEQNIANDYLEKLTLQYDAHFEGMKDIPVLRINGDSDFIDQKDSYKAIKQAISKDWPDALSDLKL